MTILLYGLLIAWALSPFAAFGMMRRKGRGAFTSLTAAALGLPGLLVAFTAPPAALMQGGRAR